MSKKTLPILDPCKHILDIHLNSFGPRLRAFVEDKGTIEKAYGALGVSRATLFNWFDRDRPPPGKKMRDKLRDYLGDEAEYILDGKLDESKSPHRKNWTAGEMTAKLREATENPTHSYFTAFRPAQIQAVSQAIFDRLIFLAAGRSDRLAWILERLMTEWPDWAAEPGMMPERKQLMALAMLASDPTRLAEVLAKSTEVQDSSQNPAVIEAKNRGRQKAFVKAAEILAEEAKAAAASGEESG